jgi:hypothetical protein
MTLITDLSAGVTHGEVSSMAGSRVMIPSFTSFLLGDPGAPRCDASTASRFRTADHGSPDTASSGRSRVR